MVKSNNNSNITPATGRQGVNNIDMVGTAAPQQSFLSMGLNPGKPIEWDTRKVYPSIKRLLLPESIPRVPRLDENKTGSQNFGLSKRIQNSISFKTLSVKNPFPTNSESRK